MNFIKKHKTSIAIAIVCLFLMVLAAFAAYRMLYPSNDKSVYGNRLNNAPIVSTENIETIKNAVLDTKLTNAVTYKLDDAIMKFFIDVKSDTKVSLAEGLSDIIISKIDNNAKTFYDIEIYLTQKEGKMVDYPAIGYHSKSAESFTWTLNKAGDTIEE